MKNKKSFWGNILMIILMGIMALTANQRNKISSHTFDKLLLLYVIIYSIVFAYTLINLIKHM